MCIDSRQSIQLCPYHTGSSSIKQETNDAGSEFKQETIDPYSEFKQQIDAVSEFKQRH